MKKIEETAQDNMTHIKMTDLSLKSNKSKKEQTQKKIQNESESEKNDAEILFNKIQLIRVSDYLTKLSKIQLLDRKENQSNLYLFISPTLQNTPEDRTIILKNKKKNLLEFKIKSFYFTNKKENINFTFLKPIKKIKIVLKMYEEIEFICKFFILKKYERNEIVKKGKR